ncbi:hypothetical protein GCM10023321_63870 [Pseudonocardia eucalypti]|uniref:PrgI family protein n=1 Tax=Pseudonocardia eucalypti TaxID=648755 RepID=A0ABP9QX09_9PSEU|nr:hypothetical protein [Pseudonocardia eucalypti]
MSSVPIPADIDIEDKIVGELTGRQVLILTAGAVLLYGAWAACRAVLPFAVFVYLAAPIAGATLALALGRRDGLTLDRWLWAAARHFVTTRPLPAEEHIEPAGGWGVVRRPSAPVLLPDRGVGETGGIGVVDLGRHGLAVLAAVSTLNFHLRAPAEQQALVAAFAGYLHSLTDPIQLLIRALPLDLSTHVNTLDHTAPVLGHPALSAAAAEHADYLAELAHQEYLRRQVILVLREPLRVSPTTRNPQLLADGDRVSLTRLARRLTEAIDLLAPAGLAVTALNATQATAVLDHAYRPNPPDALPPDDDDLLDEDLDEPLGPEDSGGPPADHIPAAQELPAELPPDRASHGGGEDCDANGAARAERAWYPPADRWRS